jgi:hypothetical protein
MVRKVQFEGRNIIVPDDATDDEVAQIIGGDVPPSPPPQKQGTTLSDVGRWIGEPYANIGRLAAEVPATLVTGMGSMIAGNVMGAASDIYSSVTGQPKVGDKVREDVMRDYTYQPRSAVTQEAFNLLGEGMKTNVGKLVQGLPVVGQELPILSSLARPATRTITGAIAEKAAAPSESIVKFAAQNQPKIDAAVQLRRLGLVADPSEVNPTLKNIAGTEFARPEILDIKAAKINLPIIQNILRNEAGVEGNVLTGETLQAARDVLSKPYNEVRKIGSLQANADLAAQLRASKPTAIVGLEKQVKEGARVIDEVAAAIEEGRLSASDAVDAIRGYRSQANNWYKIAEKGDAKRNPKEIAKAYQTVADTLEALIESNIPQDSKLLNDFRKARSSLAKNYAVEALINKESGIPDLSKLSGARFADSPLSGDLAALRQIQANFPQATAAVNKYGALLPSTINRSSVGGTAGAAASMAAGGAPVTGGVLGAVTSVLGGRFIGNKMLTPEYQAKNLFPNVPRVATPDAVVPAPTSTLPVPYVSQGEFQRGGTGSPNWVPGRNTVDPDVQPSMMSGQPSLGFTPNAEMNRPRGFPNANMWAERAAQEAEAAAPRQPASGGMLYDLDPITGRLRPADQGIKGATTSAVESTGNNLSSAVDKISSGKRFALSSEERIAWDKSRVDLAKAAPELKGLSDSAIAERVSNRQWVSNRIQELKTEYADWAKDAAMRYRSEQAAAINEMANTRSIMGKAEREALKQAKGEASRRMQLMIDTRKAEMQSKIDSLERMSDSLGQRAGTKIYVGQGPKTRAAVRGMMSGAEQ